MGKTVLFLVVIVLIRRKVAVLNATLIDCGGGLIYDSGQDITWLQHANYPNTSRYADALYGYHTDGRMNWQDARTWVDSFEYYDPLRNVTWDAWRLPSTPETEFGYTPEGEMGHLYYEGLGNTVKEPIANTGFVNNFPSPPSTHDH